MVTSPKTGGVREYARHRKALGLTGQSHAAVVKARNQGRLDGALLKDGQIDFAIADRLWQQNTMQTAAATIPDENFAEAHLRKEIALADLRELECRQKQEALISVEDADAAWRELAAIIRTEAAKLCDQAEAIAAETDPTNVRLLLMDATRDVLSRIAERFTERAKEAAAEGAEEQKNGEK